MTINNSTENAKEVLSLREYIDKYHGGSLSSFAKVCGKSSQHIWRQLQDSAFIVVSGNVVQIKYQCNPIDVNRTS